MSNFSMATKIVTVVKSGKIKHKRILLVKLKLHYLNLGKKCWNICKQLKKLSHVRPPKRSTKNV